MKPDAIIKLVITAIGAAIAGAGYLNEAETTLFIGAGTAFIGLGWLAFSRARSKTPLILFTALFAPLYFSGCSNLTPAQRETISDVLLEVAKAGLKFGLNALAQRYPDLAPFVPKLEAQFRITFSEAGSITSAEAFSAEVKRIVTEIITDPETASLVIGLLSDYIKQEASVSLSVASPQNGASVTPVIFALQVSENLKQK